MKSGSFTEEFIGGTVGGSVGLAAVYPLDTSKMRLQTYPHYKGTFDVLRTMVREQGVRLILQHWTSYGASSSPCTVDCSLHSSGQVSCLPRPSLDMGLHVAL